MAEDAAIKLFNEIKGQLTEAEQNKTKFLGDIDEVVGLIANYTQVIGTVLSFIVPYGQFITLLQKMVFGSSGDGRDSPDKQVLDNLEKQGKDELNALGIIDSRLTDLHDGIIQLDSAVELHIKYGPNSATPNPTLDIDPQYISLLSLTLVKELEINDGIMDVYWYRPFLVNWMFRPQPDKKGFWWLAELGPLKGGTPQCCTWQVAALPGSQDWALYPKIDEKHYDGFKTVFAAQLALPTYLKALQLFLTIHSLLGEEPSKTASIFHDDLINWASSLESRYETVVGGIFKTDVPDANSISFVIKYPQKMMDTLSYGVIDVYGIYEDPVYPPSKAASHIIDFFPSESIGRLRDILEPINAWNPENDQWYQKSVYAWYKDRATLMLKARCKAIYLLRGYDKAWSVLQNLRVITKQQDHKFNDTNKNWSARDLFSTLNLPAFPGKDYRLSHLVQRLDQISKGDWPTPPSPWSEYLRVFTELGIVYDPDPRDRPIGFRDRLAAAAV